MTYRKMFFACAILGNLLLSQNSGDYIGSAIGKDLESARNSALNNLVQQIQVFVVSKSATEKSESKNFLKDSTFINTVAQSFMNLNDVKESVETKDDGYYLVTKTVSQASVQKMFKERKKQIFDYLSEAERILTEQNAVSFVALQPALDNYFQAYLLSLIYPETVSHVFNNRTTTVSVGIPNALGEISRSIEFVAVKQIEDEYIVWKYRVNYKGKEVSHLRYSYFDGMGQTDGEVTNGETQMTLYYPSKEKKGRIVQVQIEFLPEDELDNTLGMAKKFLNTSILQKTFSVAIPGDRIIVQKVVKIPDALQELVKAQSSFENVLDELKKLVGKGEIVQGRASDFETLNGLYCVVVDKPGLVALLRNDDSKYFDFISQKEVQLKDFIGKRIMWFELLKK